MSLFNIYFARKNDDVKFPVRREEDGCYDLYAYFSEDYMLIAPHETKLIPTGIYSAMPSNYRIALRERGSNLKWNASIMAGQIDSGFRGEWWAAIHNEGDIPIAISKLVNEVTKTDKLISHPYNKAICQFAIEFVPNVEVKEMDLDELLQIPSCRGTGDLGSSEK